MRERQREKRLSLIRNTSNIRREGKDSNLQSSEIYTDYSMFPTPLNCKHIPPGK